MAGLNLRAGYATEMKHIKAIFFYVGYFRQKAFKTLNLFGVPFKFALFWLYFIVL